MDIPLGWQIDYNPKPIPDRRFDYDFVHEEYDGENGLCGSGQSKEDCIEQINELQQEE